jgi:Protein of unknown function (DUF3105)
MGTGGTDPKRLKQGDTEMEPEAHDAEHAESTTKPSEKRALKRRASPTEQQRRVPRSIFQPWGWGVAALVVLLIFGAIVWAVRSQPAARPHIGEIPGVVTVSVLSHYHTTSPVTYPQNPPVGGPHNPVWQNCGIYHSPITNEHAVHSMEHGAVWITYQPELGHQAVEQLRKLLRGQDYALLSPYPGLPAPVVASAWGVQLQVTSASDPRLAQFLTKYEQGPQTREPGAPCSNGTGTPDE